MAPARPAVRRPSPRPSRPQSTTGAPSCGKFLECRCHRLVIAERHDPVADNLAGFMALSGNQKHVAAAQIGNRRAYRLAPIADIGGAWSAGNDGGANGGRILAARIVVGYDNTVGLGNRDRAHQWPLAAITVAAGAEHDHQLAGRIRAQRIKCFGERVRLVRVIDEDRRAALFSDKLEATLSAVETGKGRKYRTGFSTRRHREPCSDQRILDLKLADQRQADLKSFCSVLDLQPL